MGKRRAFTPEFKARIVREELTGAKDKAEICRERPVSPQVFSRWREEFLRRAPEVFTTRSDRSEEQKPIAELERLAGRLTLELEAAKKAANILASLSARSGRR
jgi:transposase